MRTGVAIAIVIGIITAIGVAGLGSDDPAIRFAAGVPSDVEALGEATWDEFVAFFADRRDCFPDVTVDVAWHDYPERAEYFAADDRVVLRIPATAPRLRTSLLHEFAHHLEANCEAVSEMTTPIRLAQGLAPDAPWYDAELWSMTPSEHFAETVTEAIAGFRTNNTELIAVSEEAMAIVAEWAGSPGWEPRDGWELPEAG